MSSQTNGSGDNAVKPNQNGINDLSKITIKRVISVNRIRKTICVEGVVNDREGRALLFLEKNGMNLEMVKKLFSNGNCTLTKNSDDEFYKCLPIAELSGIKVTLIYPATERHIKKYEMHPFHVVNETPELYYNVTLPCITKGSFNLQWVYNIFSHQAEADSIAYEDTDPNIGFVFLPDLKWNQKQVENLYFIAIARPRDIKSLRDLREEHLPLLNNIRAKGIEVIKEKFGLSKHELRIYIHYQPSYYHLHVHFTYIEFAAPGIMANKSHLLDKVINNLELVPDYYQKCTLTFTVKETDSLFLSYKEKGVVTEVPKIEIELDEVEKQNSSEIEVAS